MPTTGSSSGYAGYFQGNVNITGNAAISGTTTLGNISVTGTCTGCGNGAIISLSSLTSATTTNSFDNNNWAQIWKWGTLSSETALTLSTSSMTTGTLLNLADNSTSGSAGMVLNVSNAQTGAGYGISSNMTSDANSGSAVYAQNASGSGYAVYATNSTTTGSWPTGAGSALYAQTSSSINSAGFFTNTSTAGRGVVSFAPTAYYGSTNAAGGNAYYAIANATNSSINGYFVSANGGSGSTVSGFNASINGSDDTIYGVQLLPNLTVTSGSHSGYGVYSQSFVTVFGGASTLYGVYGSNFLNNGFGGAATGYGVYGSNINFGGTSYGVYGEDAYGYYGVYGIQDQGTGAGYGGYFTNNSTGAGFGLYADETGASNTGYGLYASNASGTGWAGYFNGAVNVAGNLTVSSCTGCVAGSSTIYLGSLTTANPQISGEVNTGLYTAGPHMVDVSVQGGKIMEWTSTGATSTVPVIGNSFIPTSSTIPTNGMYLGAANTLDFATNSAKHVEMDSGGNLDIVAGALQITGTTMLAIPHANSDVSSVAIGPGALASEAADGLGNVAVGAMALAVNTNANGNTAVGYKALSANTTGVGNTAVGNGSMFLNIVGTSNTGLGQSTLEFNTVGSSNTAVGQSALSHSVTGNGNTAVGFQALSQTASSGNNTAIGVFAMTGKFSTPLTGSDNIAVGYQSLNAIAAAASQNVGIGDGALAVLTTSSNNVALGYSAGNKITIGGSNLILGSLVATTTLATGSNNILIGTGATVDTLTPNTSNELNIGDLIYGNLGGSANVGIGAMPSSYAALDLSSQDNALALPGNVSGTGGRPTSGNEIDGMVRYNGDTPGVEAFVNGAWQTLLADTGTGTSSNLYLGSATTANPAIFGEPTSGFYTAGAHKVDVEIQGSNIAEWSSTGEAVSGNITATQSAANLAAVSGINTAASGAGYGVYGALSSTSNTGYGIYATNATTTSGYGIYSSLTGHGNKGAAGYFVNTDTSSNTNYGLEVVSNSAGASSAVIYGQESNNTTTGTVTGLNLNLLNNMGGTTGVYINNAGGANNVNYGIYSNYSGGDPTAVYGGYFTMLSINANTNSNLVGVMGAPLSLNFGASNVTAVGVEGNPTLQFDAGSGTGYGVYGSVNVANGTPIATYGVYGADSNGNYAIYGIENNGSGSGYGGYFANTSTGAGFGLYATETGAGNTGYGIYANNASGTGWAGYFNGAVNINGNLTGTNAAFSATTTVNNIVVTGTCTGCVAGSSTIYLGSLTTANPQISGEPNTGLYTAGAHKVDVGVQGNNIAEWNSGGEAVSGNITATQSAANLAAVSGINTAASGAGYGGYFSAATTGGGYGIYSALTTTANSGYGVYATNATTTAGFGVYAALTGTGNTGYAGYFTNTDTGSGSVGLYASTSGIGSAGRFDSPNGTGAYGSGTTGVYGFGTSYGVNAFSDYTGINSWGIGFAAWVRMLSMGLNH